MTIAWLRGFIDHHFTVAEPKVIRSLPLRQTAKGGHRPKDLSVSHRLSGAACAR